MANQPGWVAGTGGVLNPDASKDSGGELSVTGATSGFYTSYYYTNNSTPSFTLSTTNILPEIELITLSFEAAGLSTFSSGSVTLTINDTVQSLTPVYSTAASGRSIVGNPSTFYTWSFDVSSLDSINSISLSWATSDIHTVYDNVQLTQAVPEPSTVAFLLIGGIALGVFAVRRRQSDVA